MRQRKSYLKSFNTCTPMHAACSTTASNEWVKESGEVVHFESAFADHVAIAAVAMVICRNISVLCRA
jgi:hypothetical protein